VKTPLPTKFKNKQFRDLNEDVPADKEESVNIDKKAEAVAKTLMGLMHCPRCGGEGFSYNDVGRDGVEKLCHLCEGSGWVKKPSREVMERVRRWTS